MATLYGENADKLLVDNPSQKAGNGDVNGRIRQMYDKFSLSADLSAADVIIMGDLIPAGARILDAKLKFDALGAGNLDLGWQASADAGEAADQDGLIDGAAVTSAGRADMASEAGFMKKFSEPVQPVVTVDVDTTATSGDIEIMIEYVVA